MTCSYLAAIAVLDQPMEAREDALLAIRTDSARAAYGNARWTSLVTTIVAVLALVAMFFLTRRIEDERLRVIQAREDFLAIASHELRNPMNAVHLHGRSTVGDPAARACS